MPSIVDSTARRRDYALAARRCLESKGVDGLRLRTVASAAGVTTGAIAHYFEDKDDLVVAALESTTDEMMRRGKTHHPQDVDGLVDLLLASSPGTKEDLVSWRVWIGFWSLTAGDERLAALSKAKYDEWIVLVEEALRGLARQGQIADVNLDQVAMKLVAMVDGLAVQVCFDVAGWPIERQRREIRDCVERLLRAPDAA
jgi:AcrR family transcriptional regulator